ncbi:MAG TPA: SCO family protein [Candidatus Acidoferrales bacterium]|nr:SCO family protein [Candidatus Acidoferrales bacterium]
MTGRRSMSLLCSVIALLSLAVSTARADEGQPEILRDVSIDQRLNEQVPLDLTFRDEAGNTVQLGKYFGSKPVILSLAYYECPMLCTLVLNGVASALKVLSFDIGKEYEVVTVSFDPREKPELAAAKKKNYVKEYGRAGAESGWHFLTGDQESIRRLTEAVGFRYKWDPDTKQFAHAAGIIVLTPQGRISRYFYGVEFAPRDLRLGLIEAADNKIGTAVDQLLLYCFHYDPKTGRYGALAINSVRLGGLVTVVALTSFVVVMLRRERRNHIEAAVPPAA